MRMTESQLAEQVRQAVTERRRLVVQGEGSKHFIGGKVQGDVLSTAEHDGIVSYQPSELVVVARAGTRLSDLQATLAEHGQFLPFEPPMLDGHGTVGGMLATGWSGAGRPWRGAVRDYVLGLRLINGRGEVLGFGGQVMKNVAGFDVSRLACGSLGALGLITQVSLKVLPCPPEERCAELDISRPALLARAKDWARVMTPITGIAHDGTKARLRLSGAPRVIEQFARKYGMTWHEDAGFWRTLQEWSHPLLQQREGLWRVSLPRFSDAPFDDALMDWSGGQYWVKGQQEAFLRQYVMEQRGHMYACFTDAPCAYPELNGARLRLHERLKQAFDPHHIFNSGRLAVTC